MIDTETWKLSDKFDWGLVWIDEQTQDRLEYYFADKAFIMNDYYVIANPDTIIYQKYFGLVVRDNPDEG